MLILAAPASHAAPATCEAVETIALPTQVPQTFGCTAEKVVTACGEFGRFPCRWTAKVRVEGVGIVGAAVRLQGTYTRFFYTARCGQAANVCEATVSQTFRAYVPERDIFPEHISAICDWQGLVAVNVRLSCELNGTPV